MKKFFCVLCVLIMFTFSSCSVLEGMEAAKELGTNTTVNDAMDDLILINNAVSEANQMIAKHDSGKYGEKVYEDGISFEDVINENNLQDNAGIKMIDFVVYRLYWDTTTHYPFWSTNGVDDIRNSNENVQTVEHESSIEITNKTNINKFK